MNWFNIFKFFSVSEITDLSARYARLLELAREADAYPLMNRLIEQVEAIFRKLYPLSTPKNYRFLTNEDGEVWLRRWLENKKYDRYSPIWKSHFFKLIKKFGRDLTPYVRPAISKMFEKLSNLVNEIKDYDEISLSVKLQCRKVYYPYFEAIEDSENSIIDVDEVRYKAGYSRCFFLAHKGKEVAKIFVDSTSNFIVTLQLIDVFTALITDVIRIVRRYASHNNEILRQMMSVTSVMDICNSIKKYCR